MFIAQYRRWSLLAAAALMPSITAAQPRPQDSISTSFLTRPLRIPMREAGPDGLEALLVQPNEPGAHPLVVLTHGRPATALERSEMTPQRLLPEAVEFARRGWATAIIMRRGYGTSGGRYAESILSCEYPNYQPQAREPAKDLQAAISYLSTLPEVDARRIVAVGASAGGLAATALTADPPPGLVAAVNFAGGSGHAGPNEICQPGGLLSMFWLLGKKSRVPMLWVYAENDTFFNPEIAESMYQEFTKAGGKATFIAAPPFGTEGHSLFSPSGIPVWTRYVDDFLMGQGLVLRSDLLPLPTPPHVGPPRGLTPTGKKAFQDYLILPGEKAFAVDPGRTWGYEYGRRTREEAKKAALQHCERGGSQGCRVVILNNSSASE